MTMDDLPTDMLVEILSRAGEKSSATLFTAKSTCKRFLDASTDNLVYKRLSQGRFPVIQWLPNHKQIECMERCKQAGNPHAVLRVGLIQYFHENNPDLGMSLIKDAAESGVLEAVYVLGLILLASGIEDQKSQGLDMLNRTFTPILTSLEDTRRTVVIILMSMWHRNPRLSQDTGIKCQVAGHRGYVPHPFADVLAIPYCMTCFWCRELKVVVRWLSGLNI